MRDIPTPRLASCVPAISVGYSEKSRELLAGVGLDGYCHAAATLDLDLLQEQFAELESRRLALRPPALEEATQPFAQQVHVQFDEIATMLLLTPVGGR
ncbi:MULTISPECIES: hypothetical protein [Pseudonocardia]|uniref:hypothetical protein n=1 Tax=Pseudonocardia TaxID=1847 RepID=UPI0011814038|nr:hypothetical protein [Pseudonocardia dioxanivorans]